MGRLTGKVALITGGASGLGKATGQLMAKEGATVILSDLQEVEGTAVSREILDNGGKCSFLKQDTTSEEGWREICDYILERYGHLDILLNGAGVGSSAIDIEDMDFSTWRNCLSVNLDGVFLGCKYGIKAMRKGNGGSIINISSILGFAGLATATNYCASKGGVRLLTKAAALECARKHLSSESIQFIQVLSTLQWLQELYKDEAPSSEIILKKMYLLESSANRAI